MYIIHIYYKLKKLNNFKYIKKGSELINIIIYLDL